MRNQNTVTIRRQNLKFRWIGWKRLVVPCLLLGMVGCDNNRVASQNANEPTNENSATANTPESSADSNTQDQEPQEQDPKEPSPIDAAIKALNEQEPIDPREKPEIPPTEVHEALQPLVADHWVRMNPGFEVWLDAKDKQVIVGGRISLRDGVLEMFACPMGTKTHESIVGTLSDAQTVHLGLVGVGAIPGKPAKWTEETGLVTAQGPKCEIKVLWTDPEGTQQTVLAKEMVQDRVTGSTLQHDWVFCGSHVWVDPGDPSYREYQADHGDMICVSNFPSAMLDLNVESSATNSGLLFTANPDKVPALGTPVLIFIKPLTDEDAEEVSEEEAAANADQIKKENTDDGK